MVNNIKIAFNDLNDYLDNGYNFAEAQWMIIHKHSLTCKEILEITEIYLSKAA